MSRSYCEIFFFFSFLLLFLYIHPIFPHSSFLLPTTLPLHPPIPFPTKCFSVCPSLHSKSVSSPLRKKEVKRWKETKRQRESMQERWKMMAFRISILRWDTISIIEFNFRSLPLCSSLRELCCQFVFSQGWVKLGANPSCSAEGTHKQHNVTSYSLLSTWKFRGRCLQPSKVMAVACQCWF